MTRLDNIIRFLARATACLALALCANLDTFAAATTPPGSGTKADPYRISLPGHLEWLAANANNNRWTADNGNYIQTADLDMTGITLSQPIGSTTGFAGTYNGQGYAIRNLSLRWKSSPIVAGLFGYVNGGTLCNIVIENAVMNITEELSANDYKIGILAGAISPNTSTTPVTDAVVENIIIRGSSINDGGKDNKKNKTRAFIGGVIGDFTQGYAQTKPIPGSTRIANIHANVNISLEKLEQPDNNIYQYNIGGIIGRIRTAKKGLLPKNTFYSGDIKAPTAMISPMCAAIRVTGANAADWMAEHYAGQVVKESSTAVDAAPSDYDFLDLDAFNTNHFYSSYRVYDSSISDYVNAETITSGYNVEHEGVTISLKTLSSEKPLSTWTESDMKANMRSYQGVNHGTHISDGIQAAMLEAFNTQSAADGMEALWVAEDGTAKLVLPQNRFSVEHDTGSKYVVKYNGDADLSSQSYFTVTGFSMADEQGNELDISHLSDNTAISSSSASIIIDKAFLPRTITARLTNSTYGLTGNAKKTDIAATTYGIDASTAPCKAVIDDKTGPEAYAGKTYHWDILFDDGSTMTADVPDLADAEMGTKAALSGEFTLTIHDPYGDWTDIARFIGDTRKVQVTRSGNVLTATVPGIPADEGTWVWRGFSGDIPNDISKSFILNKDKYNNIISSNELTINSTNDNYDVYAAVWTSTDGSSALIGFLAKKDIIYVFNKAQSKAFQSGRFNDIVSKYPDGNNANNGRTPYTAVKTMQQAYALLDPGKSKDDNIVVVMGYQGDNDYLKFNTATEYNNFFTDDPSAHKFQRDATVTGAYGDIKDGVIKMRSTGGTPGTANDQTGIHGLDGATVFHDITFYGGGKTDGNSQMFFYCHLHDLTIDGGVKTEGYNSFSANDSGIYNSKSTYTTIVGGFHNYDNPPLQYPATNFKKGKTTINIASGNWGRIIASGRNDGPYNNKSKNIFGHPDTPHRVEINVNIKHAEGKGMEEFAPDQALETAAANKYKYDIGLITGGQTDGSVYVESELTLMEGKVGRFVSGNISYGRDIKGSYPSDGFFGSTTLTIEGGEIGELVGGTLGRWNSTASQGTAKCEAYFYGRSILNINGGVINNNIYGAGAGGVVGIGTDDREGYHTEDPYIPYKSGAYDAHGRREIIYGDYYTAKGNMPDIILLNGDTLDLADSYCEVNINGGTIHGDVFGGGYGYSEEVTAEKALGQTGDLFGRTLVNINGGTIHGDVYGGGAGTSKYYNEATDPDEKKAFEDIACVFGDTRVNIRGGVIEGRVYAGSKGIKDFPKMATLFGNTHLVVEDVEMSNNTIRVPIINDHIFGGSKLGRITGSTEVLIKGGAIGNCIFAGSEGIDSGDSITTARIEGDTYLEIRGGTYVTEEHLKKISEESQIKLTPANRTFNIYGGGFRNCIIAGNTQVNIYKSLLSSFRCLLEGRTFQECAADESYRKFSVYGAGQGILTDIFGNAYLSIDITGGASAPSSEPVDIANEQQFFMICGGGFAGNVYGNTNVTLSNNVFARQAYGGGMYGRVEGTANLTVNGGSYYKVYGGGLLGDIMKGANLTIGVKATEGTEASAADSNRGVVIYDDVYGGNDVGGIVGYERATDSHGDLIEWIDKTDSEKKPFPVRVLYKDDDDTVQATTYNFTLHSSSDDYGVNMIINGGTIKGSVFGGGNGHHTGYYVPNRAQSEHHAPGAITRMRYHEGPAYLYRFNTNDPEMADKSLLVDSMKINWGLYEYRPRVRRVRMHIGGNSETDRVNIEGSVFGGGHACTIGKFNPEKDVLRDPSRFEGGGTLKINFGSHVTVKDGVYMGSRGDIIGKQTVIEHDSVYAQTVLNSDYDYHYYDPSDKTYKLGFPNTVDGRNRFHAYIKLIDMNAKTQLTFYNDPQATEHKLVNGIPENLPDHKAYTPAQFDATDLRWGSFFAGGARGSMTYEPDADDPLTGQKPVAYEYTLPHGLTIETRAVGGSEDAQIKYYEYTDDYKSFDTSKPVFTYDGGIVYDRNDGTDGHYGGGVVLWDGYDNSLDDTRRESDRQIGTESARGTRVVMRLNVDCDFDPQMSYYIDEHGDRHDIRYGGLVYGGCYNSGITNGSVDITCTNNLLGSYYDSDDYHDYLAWSTLRHNIGRVYGGGFGSESSIWGETHVTLDNNFRGFNVFGGGMMGHVTHGTHVIVKGVAKVFNAVYGGGMRGHVGYDVLTTQTDPDLQASPNAQGSRIDLISGGVDRVYGGAFMGNIYGGTHILVSDEGQPDNTPRMLIGTIYGGNDVTGTIYEDPSTHLSTDIRVAEEPRADKESYAMSQPSQDAPGKFYGGYPLIGTIYGAGNGNMGDYIPGVTIDRDAHAYRSGSIHIANGHQADIDIWDFAQLRQDGKTFHLPDVQNSRITINGGTIINVYGGGSMCTVKGKDELIINYADTVVRAAVPTSKLETLTWGVLRLFQELQQREVTTQVADTTRFSYQIYRAFGGNNLMDMAIQPTWQLTKGNIFSVYSGGNFGRMTYCRDSFIDEDPSLATKPRGLSLTINSDDIRIESVYGGGRVGDIHALVKKYRTEDGVTTTYHEEPDTPFAATEYGATLNVLKGTIGDVYGGNNVAGTVYNGTNVNIQGAISGNVYGSGNGNYLYLYDHDNTRGDIYNPDQITEGYSDAFGGRYFILPRKAAYTNGADTVYYGRSDEEKILAINSYRPNVEKAYLNISGSEDSKVHVLGNVYCGGNSSTVLYDPQDTGGGNIRFEIGSHVTLGGVFLGSNGESLANPFNIGYLANLNDIGDMGKKNQITKKPGFTFADISSSPLHYNDKASCDTLLYPNLLSLYMRAAEVAALPTEFRLPDNTVEAYIGNFTIGGNRGSMMTGSTINLTLPENITFFGRIVAGCYDSHINYNNAECVGGIVKPLPDGVTDRINLTIKSKFRPWRMLYQPDAAEKVTLVNDRIDKSGNYVATPVAGETYYYTDNLCNIFGGCYTSGKITGNINIDLYSDVLGRYEQSATSVVENGETILTDSHGRYIQVNRKQLMNNVALRRTVYALTGAGYGPESEVEGNISLRLMPQATTGTATTHPTISTIFGGSHNGKHIGNSTTFVRDGMVFSNLYAGSRAAYKYGSSEVIVGYPTYYICNTSGEYTLERADQVTGVALTDKLNHDGTPVIKKKAKYLAGDIVASNVFEQIKAHDSSQASAFTPTSATPGQLGTKWSNISINIGDNSAMNDTGAHFYGGGGIYGGGHAINGSAKTNSGTNTQLAFSATDENGNPAANYLHPAHIGYGGNSTIIVGDNTDDKETVSHISIGTGHYVETVLDTKKGNKIGHYVKDTDPVTGNTIFVHQAAGKPVPGTKYYKMETDGGIYGDGRRTFVEKFRAVDITGYGYADHTPQSAKLINTFQRIDLLSLNDCCLQLQGACDYATNAIDATPYSIARVGELRLNSTLTGNIQPSTPDSEVAGCMKLDKLRSRNYMGFFSNVHYIGAIHSNTSFSDDLYRGPDGKPVAGTTYMQRKEQYIAAYEAAAKSSDAEAAFKKRNLATSPNMIGINNGFTLKLKNAVTISDSTNIGMLKNVPTDSIYYGPVVGVVEVKLLTLAEDEGGGYIYAFNQHKTDAGGTGKTFLEETGNFVYPSAIDEAVENYIVDDCHPLGYYDNATNATKEEVHYWYVQGHHYYFNATLTGYTYNSPINFKLDNTDNLIMLSGITPEQSSTIDIESVLWETHLEADDKCALTNNLSAEGKEDSRADYQLYLTIDKNTSNEYDLKQSAGEYTNVGNAFVARIPNGNNQTAGEGASETLVSAAYAANADGTIQRYNNYSNAAADNKNSPLLGIRLQDTDTLNYRPQFFKDHLATPDHLVIEIKAKDSEGKDNRYTINLDIVYLQGPYIDGKVAVENCALPGECIYANTGDVIMEMDDALTVTGKRWYLYPKIKPDPAKEIYTWDKDNRIDVSQYLMDNITGDVNRIELPARYYQNDWKLGYCVVVNGQDFELPDPGDESNRITVHNYHRMSAVPPEIKKGTNYGYNLLDPDLVGGALVYIEDDIDFEIFTKYVNYCNSFRSSLPAAGTETRETTERMKDYQYEVRDGVLWQKEVNNGGHEAKVLRAQVLPGYNAKGYITGFLNEHTILGLNDDSDVHYQNVKNPSGAENIRFVLNADITLNDRCETITEFRGILHGNGHTITAGSTFTGRHLIDTNYGQIRNLGVISQGGEDGAPVFNENYGTISDSYYYFYKDSPGENADRHAATYASLIGSNKNVTTHDGKKEYQGVADNCYQNTNRANAHDVAGMHYRSNSSFHYGLVAYNLNQEYLKARYKSKNNDDDVRETMADDNYLYEYYADGDYRYASVRSADHTEGLRMSENLGVPNYNNDLRSGRSLHYTSDDYARDDSRWFKISQKRLIKRDQRGNIVYTADDDGNVVPELTDEGYFPIYLYDADDNLAAHSDFIFFGQRLVPDPDDRQYHPGKIDDSNRVYRAGGSHGTRSDMGFHFNRDAYVLQPTLTAVDFTGHLDLPDPADADSKTYYNDWGYYLYDKKTGSLKTDTYQPLLDSDGLEVIDRSSQEGLMQVIYYPPVLDLPGGDAYDNLHNLVSFDIVSNDNVSDHSKVTKNLLVYTPQPGTADDKYNTADSERLFGKLHYTRMQNWGDVLGETQQDNLLGHHLQWTAHDGTGGLLPHFHAYGGLFHLADKQDFNAPIEFFVASDEGSEQTTGRAWMLRMPEHYASRPSEPNSGKFTIGKDAWESIALPFTCNRVVAVNSGDYIKKYSRGQITHFYGSDPSRGVTHHDYWLRGLVSSATDTHSGDDVVALAGFARPGSEQGLFQVKGDINDDGTATDMQMTGDYSYYNNWFWESYERGHYVPNHNEYADTLMYYGYRYLTKNAPYIVAFPGSDYKEFDLSGEFYNQRNSTDGCHRQEILYEFTVDEIDPGNNFDSQTANVRIPVTDIYDAVRSTVVGGEGGDGITITHKATFSRIAIDYDDDDADDNLYVLNAAPVTADVQGEPVTFAPGSVFINCKDFGVEEILPFRTYLVVDGASAGARRYVAIGEGTRAIESFGDDSDDKGVQEEEQPAAGGLHISVQGNSLVITSDQELRLSLYGISGVLYRNLHVKAGRNVYDHLSSGVYAIAGKKFAIKK